MTISSKFSSYWANGFRQEECYGNNQTLVEWSFYSLLPKLCPVIPIVNQDGRQAKNRKRGDEIH
jgi:hypothetical protein